MCVVAVALVIGAVSVGAGGRVGAQAPAAVEAQQPVAATSAAGAWAGQINLPSGTMAFAVVLNADSSGVWSGTIDMPSQGAKGSLANIVVNGRDVAFGLAGIAGNPRFVGTIAGDGQTMTGTLTQGVATLAFELKRGALPVAVRPQEPKPPFPYRQELVNYRNPTANIVFAGTLTLPPGNGPFPAVLLISGSGAQDRDSTIMGHKPFLLLADTLTRRGIAVLRVDDRGVGGTGRGTIAPTSADLADDVRAGVTYLAGRPDIDTARLGLIGHSEGASIAALVAADTPAVRFIVMLAGQGVRGDELMMQQVAALAAAQNLPQPLIDWDYLVRRRVYDQILSERDGEPDPAARQALIDGVPPIPGMPDATQARQTVTQLLNAMSGRWWRYMLAHDVGATLRRVTVPVLAVIGERDLQIPARENIPAIRAALDAAGNKDATVRALPDLNHLLQTAKTGHVAEYAVIEETMSPVALTLVADWLGARTK
jgi:pimeloyl-ACP methyl ester carboxylesterase